MREMLLRIGGGISPLALVNVWHHVQGALVLLPAGTIYRRTPKPYLVGKVQSVLSAVLAQAGRNGKYLRHS